MRVDSRAFIVVSSQSGYIIPLFAAFSSLLVLLLLRVCIDVPTYQSAVIRGQIAVDSSNESAMSRFWDPIHATRGASAMATAMALGNYSPLYPSTYFNSVTQSAVAVPMFSTSVNPEFFGVSCSHAVSISDCSDEGLGVGEFLIETDTYYDPNIAVPNRRFSDLASKYFNINLPGQFIQDFGNGIVHHMTFRPFSYLSPLTVRPASVVGALRLAGTMAGVIVDQVFPVNGLYTRIFPNFPDPMDPGLSPLAPLPKDINFPLASYRTTPDLADVINDPEILKTGIVFPRPVSGAATGEWATNGFIPFQPSVPPGLDINQAKHPFSFDPSGSQNLYSVDPPNYNIYKNAASFFSATCDSLPFYHYKSAVVHLLDLLGRSSAFSPHTPVGVFGFKSRQTDQTLNQFGWTPDDAVVPIFPVVEGSGGYDEFAPVTAYPTQIGTSPVQTRYLHERRAKIFKGYLDPATYVDASNNHPELAYCSEYYLNSTMAPPVSGIAGPALPEDLYGSSGETAAFNYWDPARRYRSRPSYSSNRHWYDDDYDNSVPSTKLEANVGLHQSGSSSTDDGETPRNIIGQLAMRLRNYNLPTLVSNPASWSPPKYGVGPTETENGYRYLPAALRKMCNYIAAASTSYNNDPTETYGRFRPIEQQALIAFTFGVHSPVALSELNISPATNAEVWALQDFRNALEVCLCGRPDFKLLIGALGLDLESTLQTAQMVAIAREFETRHNNQCIGEPNGTSLCGGGEVGTLIIVPFTILGDRYESLSAEERVIAATRDFSRYFHEVALKLITRWNNAV